MSKIVLENELVHKSSSAVNSLSFQIYDPEDINYENYKTTKEKNLKKNCLQE